MQTIPFGGLIIGPGPEMEGYDEQKDLIERGLKKIRSVCIANGGLDAVIVRAVPTEERGTLFTAFIEDGDVKFGLYSNGGIRQNMVYGHPPIRIQHMDRLCDRVENDLQGRLKYKDDPRIEKAWQAYMEAKFEAGVNMIGTEGARQL